MNSKLTTKGTQLGAVKHFSVQGQKDKDGAFAIHPVTGERINAADVKGQKVNFRSIKKS